jgi:hypothetical protein
MKYKVGDTITYSTFGRTMRTGVVTLKANDIKHGMPGFWMVTEEGGEFWGYDNQIASVDNVS